MFEFKSLNRSGFLRFRFSVLFLLIAFACLFTILFADRIVAFSINHLTDYSLTYDKWRGNPFAKSEIEGLNLKLNKGTFVVAAQKGHFNLKTHEFLKERQLILVCEMEGVSFPPADKDKPAHSPRVEGEAEGAFSGNVLAIPFSPDQKYDRVIFTVSLSKNIVKVTDFRAYSRDVRMEGDYTHFKDKDEIFVDLKISFSPNISGMLEDSIKENVLSPDEGGWYSTVIDYKGNPAFLYALYSLTTAT